MRQLAICCLFAISSLVLQGCVETGGDSSANNGNLNTAPTAGSATLSTGKNRPISVTLPVRDADGDALTITIDTAPSNGQLSNTGLRYTYAPNTGFVGSDQFAFTVSDGRGGSASGTVRINISDNPQDPANAVPSAVSATYSVEEDRSKTVVLRATGPGPLRYTVLTQPAHGSLSGTAPTLVYTPTADFNGDDSFTFNASNSNGSSEPATALLRVRPVNDRPVANAVSASTNEDMAVNITLSGSDVDGDSLSFAVFASPAHGTVSGSGSGSTLTYTPVADYNGTDSFSYRVSDGTTSSSSARVSISIAPAADTPTAQNVSVTVSEDNSVNFDLIGSDPDGEPRRFAILVQPSHGVIAPANPSSTTRNYLPDANYNGSDTLTFVVKAGSRTSSPATVNFTVTPVNDAPVANPQSLEVAAGASQNITLTASDADSGDTLSYAVLQGPDMGALSGTPPSLTYTAPEGEGSTQFSFRATDAAGASSDAIVQITIAPAIQGRAVLGGPLAGATVKIIPIASKSLDSNGALVEDDLATSPESSRAGSELATITATTTGGNVFEAGFFSFRRSLITDDGDAIGAYLITVQGGQDLDVNEDAVTDANPAPNNGQLRAVVSKQRLLAGSFSVNALTTALADRVYLGLQRERLASALTRMSADTALLVGREYSGDGVVDVEEAYRYLPSLNRNNLRRPADKLASFNAGIRGGVHDVQDSSALLSPRISPRNSIGASLTVVSGNLAYSADVFEPANFRVTDISLPHDLRSVSSVALPFVPSLSSDMVRIGNHVWLSGFQNDGQGNRLFSVDISNTSNPSAGSGTVTAFVQNLGARDNVLFGLFDGVFRAYDVTNAANPVQLGELTDLNCFSALTRGNTAYLLCRDNTLRVVDTSNPGALTLLGTMPIEASIPRGVMALEGNRLAFFRSLAPTEIRLFDVSNPSTPSDLGSIAAKNIGRGQALLMKGGIAYLGSNDQRITALDVRIPGAYQLLGSWRVSRTSTRNLADLGDALLAGSSTDLSSFDYAAPLQPLEPLDALAGLRALFPIAIATLPDDPGQRGVVFAVDNSQAATFDTRSSSKIGVGDRETVFLSVSATRGYAAYLEYPGDFIGPGQIRLASVPFGGPRPTASTLNNAIVVKLNADAQGFDVDALGSSTAVASADGVQLFSTVPGNLANSSYLRTLALDAPASQVKQYVVNDVSGNSHRYAAVLLNTGNTLQILDLEGGGNPLLGSLDTRAAGLGGCTFALELASTDTSSAVLLVGCERGLAVVDSSSPNTPALLGRIASTHSVTGVLALGRQFLASRSETLPLLAFAEGGAGLRIVDFTNPARPKALEVIETYSPIFSVAAISRNPLRLVTGESTGIIPVQGPYYPVR